MAPSNAFDYIGLFNTAMHSNDPVLFIEHQSLYDKKFVVPQDNLDFCIPFGKANIIQEGDDITIVAYGSMADRMGCLLNELTSRGVAPELIDLRTLDSYHIDYTTIMASLKKTGALIIVEEAPRSMSIGPRVASKVHDLCFDYLDGPTCCLSSLDVPNSVSRVLEKAALVSDEQILDTVEAVAKRGWH